MAINDIHILFVDDEPDTLNAIARLLHKESYAVHVAGNGADALAVMTKTPIHVIVTDMMMPGMDGLSLLRQVKGRYPDTVRVALSAYMQIGQLLPCINTGEIFRYITKPAKLEDLKQSLCDAIEYFLVRKDRIALAVALQEKNAKLEQALEKQKEVEKQLQRLAVMDDVTELYNRRFLTYSLEHQFEQCKRNGKDLSCLMIDLDHFKQICDAHGYGFGEYVLREFTARLKKVISKMDLGFRYGGERFVVLLPDTMLEKALAHGNSILEMCRSTPFDHDGRSVTVTVSIGAASLKRHRPQTPDILMLLADKMLTNSNRIVY